MKCQCGTIRQVHQQLLADGYHVTVNALRAWAKQGVLPVAYIGKKAYLTYDNAVNGMGLQRRLWKPTAGVSAELPNNAATT